MIRPTITIINSSRFEFPAPKTEEADIIVRMGAMEPEDGMLTIFITESMEEVALYGTGKRFVYFVYIGTDCPAFTEEPYVMDVIYPPGDPEDMISRAERWLRIVIRDYQAWIYRHMLQTLIDASPDIIWFKDSEERHVVLNKAFCMAADRDYDACLNRKPPEIWDIPLEEYEKSDFASRQSERIVMETDRTGVFQEPVRVHGELRQFTAYKAPVHDYFGNILGTCGIAHDVTNINNMGKELDIFLSAIPYPVFLCDRNYEIQRMNRAAHSMVNVQGSTMSNYRTWKKFFLKREAHIRAGEGKTYIYMQGATRVYYSVIEREVKDFFSNPTGYLCMLRDVTYQCMYDDLMFQSANIDPLTGLYNRRYFYDAMEQSAGKPLTLLYMDLDNFKKVNDSYGHSKGDEILKTVADIIREQFPDGRVIRLGGDEFALLLDKYTERDDLKECLSAISGGVTALADADLGLGISIGHEATESLESVEEFVKACDERMYEKKHRHHRRKKTQV